ncbi:hypothetical protein D3C72_2455620 [compost metagenome]
MTDHCDSTTGGDLEVHIVQDLPTRVVTEAHGLEAYPGLAGIQDLGVGSILHVLTLVEQAEQSLHVG